MKNIKIVLTLAEVFKIFPNWFSIVDQWSVCVQIRGWSVGQGVVVEMVQLAVVAGRVRRPHVQERTTQELGFYFACQPARSFGCYLCPDEY